MKLGNQEIRNNVHQKRGTLSLAAKASLLALLVFPGIAFLRLAQFVSPHWLVGYFACISCVTYTLYKQDKKIAQTGGWRTPEFTLHFAEILGGWPVAFVAQRIFRHKISKISYQIRFWTFIALHEIAAFDSIQNWKYMKEVFLLLQL